MEGWSPQTLVRYGFSVEDESGNIVSIWNFSELEEHLRRIDSSRDDDESVVTQDEDGILGSRNLATEFDGIEPSPVTNAVDIPQLGVIDVAVVGLSVDEANIRPYVLVLPRLQQLFSTPVDAAAVINRAFHDNHVREMNAWDVEDNDDGHDQNSVAPCPLCKWEYRRFVSDFYADMPNLEGPEVDSAMLYFYINMPDLESCGATDNCELDSAVVHMCGKICLLQLICDVFNVPSPVFTDFLEVILSLCLIRYA
ncbi:hypothetical protein M758_UG125900 [Ceratodon purpureus]|nr:hypothetical protein M758_UG125900 [Ceratodon purpureus]